MKRLAAFFMSMFLFTACLSRAAESGLSVRAEDKNIALGKSYTIHGVVENDYSYGHAEQGVKTQLTDGKYGDIGSYYSGAWSHFVRGVGRYIILDLGEEMAVSGFKTRFIQEKTTGIYCPLAVSYSMSLDGEGFCAPFEVKTTVPNSQETRSSSEYELHLDTSYRARYIKIEFNVSVNSFLDEIEVYGGALKGGETGITVVPTEEEELYFASAEELGFSDMVCFHNGYYPNDPTVSDNKRDAFKPYIGYIDKNGNYVDTMFDAVMFLIVQGLCPSGGDLNSGKNPTIMSDWEYLLENTFAEGINLDALNQETAAMKEELDLDDDYKIKVYLTIPYPKESDIVFGDYKGTGEASKIENLEDRIAVYEWYLGLVLDRFETEGYENLELRGFFWNSESINTYLHADETEFVKRGVEILHEHDLQSIYIPMYQSDGISFVEEMGFDVALMQPNLQWNDALKVYPHEMMQEFASTAAKYHLGMQIEISDNFYGADKDRDYLSLLYYHYIYAAAASGIMKDAPRAYYQGAGYGTYYRLAYDSNEAYRDLYDMTYKFIKKELVYGDFELIATEKLEAKGNERVYGTCDISGDWSNYIHNLRITSHPDNGDVILNKSDGTFSYKAFRGFTGEDSFSVACDDLDGNVYEKEIKIVVAQGADATSSEVISEMVSSLTENDNEGLKTGIIAGVASALVVAAAVLAVVVKKKKNKGK